MAVRIRDLVPADRAGWEQLWLAYLDFYGQPLPAETTGEVFRRLLPDGDPAMGGLVAEVDGGFVGLLHHVVHPHTWSSQPVCYLEDLFVDASARGCGVGRALIGELVVRGRAAGWRRIYWHTDTGNDTARLLYDRVAELSDYVRYEVELG